MEHKETRGHLSALFTVVMWGTTFISTKILLTGFAPVEILLFRFVLGFLALFLACPKGLGKLTLREELMFAAAGLCGITLYYLLENIALTFTMASNVGVIVSMAPLFTAMVSRLFLKEEKLGGRFYLGLAVAMAGICLISFNGMELKLNPMGDILALAAAVVWAFYAVLTRKISDLGFSTIPVTRKMFFYGILFMLPALFFMDFRLGPERFMSPVYLFNLIYLGVGASAMCFVTWNFAVRVLGAVRTSIYIYLTPAITVAASALILHEKITLLAAVGTLLALSGLFLSESH